MTRALIRLCSCMLNRMIHAPDHPARPAHKGCLLDPDDRGDAETAPVTYPHGADANAGWRSDADNFTRLVLRIASRHAIGTRYWNTLPVEATSAISSPHLFAAAASFDAMSECRPITPYVPLYRADRSRGTPVAAALIATKGAAARDISLPRDSR
jgi:hypothetical protein